MTEAPKSSLNMRKVVKFRNLRQKGDGGQDTIQISKFGEAVPHVMCLTIGTLRSETRRQDAAGSKFSKR